MTTKAANEVVTYEYLVYVFILLVDNKRYNPLKAQSDNILLMGKQEYPGNVMPTKRLMTDYVPTISTTKQRSKPAEPNRSGLCGDKGQEQVVPHMLMLWKSAPWV